jgi:uncharacterized protein YciI
MPEYIYLIHPYRRELAFHPTEEEEAILSEHLAYLQKAASEGTVRTPIEGGRRSQIERTVRTPTERCSVPPLTVLLAGPCLDGIFGVVILRAKDEAAAQQFMFNDPAVKGDLMAAELHAFRVAVMWGRPPSVDLPGKFP